MTDTSHATITFGGKRKINRNNTARINPHYQKIDAYRQNLSDSPLRRNLTWHRPPPSGKNVCVSPAAPNRRDPFTRYSRRSRRRRGMIKMTTRGPRWSRMIASTASRDKANHQKPRLHPIVDDEENILFVLRPLPPVCRQDRIRRRQAHPFEMSSINPLFAISP